MRPATRTERSTRLSEGGMAEGVSRMERVLSAPGAGPEEERTRWRPEVPGRGRRSCRVRVSAKAAVEVGHGEEVSEGVEEEV